MSNHSTNQIDKHAPEAYKVDMALTNLQSMTPPEVDALLFPLLAERYDVASRAGDLRNTLAKTIWPVEYKERFEKYYSRFDSKVYAIDIRFGTRQLLDTVERLNKLIAQQAEIQAQIDPYEAEFIRRGGWTRFLLVGGGHIHIPHRCGSIRLTTRAGWIIDASGFEADEVVRKYDYTACTKCFPEAPVGEPTADPSVCTAGPYEHSGTTPHARYRTCNGCGYFGAVTNLGKLRKHKKAGKS